MLVLSKRLLTLVLLLTPTAAMAQTTTVTGTITDPQGNPYQNGTASAQKVVSSGQNPGPPFNTTTNAAGLFSFSGLLALPSPASYIFTICAAPSNIGPKANPTPTQLCFSNILPIAISGASQDVSATLNALAPALGPSLSNIQGANNSFTGNNSFTNLTVSSTATLLGVPNLNGTRRIDGTKYPATNTGFTQAITDAGAGGTVIVPPNTTISMTGSIAFTGNVHVKCESQDTSIITNPGGTAATFTPSGTITSFEVEGCTLQGNGGTSTLISFSGITSSEARISFHDNVIKNFPGTALTSGVSTYIVYLTRNRWLFNGADIFQGDQSDMYIEWNFFDCTATTTSLPRITLNGTDAHIVNNTFVHCSATATGSDIKVTPQTGVAGTTAGLMFIAHNKFGPEGEINNRPKIQVSGTGTLTANNYGIIDNSFDGPITAPSQAIQFLNPCSGWIIDANRFKGFSVLIDDQAIGQPAPQGSCIFGAGNIISENDAQSWNLFSNGGRDFAANFTPFMAREQPNYPWTRYNEAPELRNRLTYSEDFTQAYWVKNGVSVTAGQTDPYGTTRATLLTRANLSGSESINALINGMGSVNRYVIKFFAKAGTTDRLFIGVLDNNTGFLIGQSNTFQLNTNYRETPYKITFSGLNPAHTYNLALYPAGTTQQAGTVTVFGLQVSDYDSDYLPSVNQAANVDTASGNRFERNTTHAQGLTITGGTVFPSSPAAGRQFYRTDILRDYFFDGTGWHFLVGGDTTDSLTNKTLNVPLTSGTGLQIFNTTTSCTTAATAFVTCTTAAISLPVAEADTSYRLVCTPHGPTNFPVLVGTTISSATQFTITIEATTAAAATFASYDCIAGHN